jgi:hypothetical protein
VACDGVLGSSPISSSSPDDSSSLSDLGAPGVVVGVLAMLSGILL